MTLILIHLPNRNVGVWFLELETYFRSKIPMLTFCWTKGGSFLLWQEAPDSCQTNFEPQCEVTAHAQTLCCKISKYFKMLERGGEGGESDKFFPQQQQPATPCSSRTDMQIYRIPSSADSFCWLSFCPRTEQTKDRVSGCWVMVILNISNIVTDVRGTSVTSVPVSHPHPY